MQLEFTVVPWDKDCLEVNEEEDDVNLPEHLERSSVPARVRKYVRSPSSNFSKLANIRASDDLFLLIVFC